MIIAYDTEFVEDGSTIGLLSIGLAAEDGREYYAVNHDPALMLRAVQHPWVRRNVVSQLPVRRAGAHPDCWEWDMDHPDWPAVATAGRIATEVREFIQATPAPELWAWYGAYDHVALCQLWGPMIRLPDGIPMWTSDLKQEAARLGNPALPAMPGAAEHNALHDAREVLYRMRALQLARRLP